MTSQLSPIEGAELLRQRTEDALRLLLDLSDEQLALTTQPSRARAPVLEETIEALLIGHYGTHHEDIRAKTRGFDERT